MVVNNEMKTRWTIADLEFLPDNGDRYEIIGGELYVTHAPNWRHQDVLNNLAAHLTWWKKQHQQGKVLQTPGLIFASEDNVIPDLIWISNEKIAACEDDAGHFTAAPELVVEVLSRTK